MTLAQGAQIVANDFLEAMHDGEFDSFQQMADCYWWDSADIKEEVSAILRIEANNDVWVDEEDGLYVYSNENEMVTYREFARMWRKLVK